MKKYTFALVFSALALAAITPAFAGGGFDDYTLNPDGTVNSVNGGTSVAPSATGEVVYDENGNVINQKAEAGESVKSLRSPLAISIIVVLLLVAGGLIYWSYKKSQPGI